MQGGLTSCREGEKRFFACNNLYGGRGLYLCSPISDQLVLYRLENQVEKTLGVGRRGGSESNFLPKFEGAWKQQDSYVLLPSTCKPKVKRG